LTLIANEIYENIEFISSMTCDKKCKFLRKILFRHRCLHKEPFFFVRWGTNKLGLCLNIHKHCGHASQFNIYLWLSLDFRDVKNIMRNSFCKLGGGEGWGGRG
jgi:hypothetical protein